MNLGDQGQRFEDGNISDVVRDGHADGIRKDSTYLRRNRSALDVG